VADLPEHAADFTGIRIGDAAGDRELLEKIQKFRT
jgi:hypothetical protein